MDVDPFIYEANNRPIDDFCGLSAAEMHQLVHNPISEDSVVRFKKPITDDVLDRIPLARLLEEFIRLFNEKTESMKLTSTGSLQQGVLRELYAKGIVRDDYLDYRNKPGDVLFITGGEKDVLSLAAQGFNAICFNSETAIIPRRERVLNPTLQYAQNQLFTRTLFAKSTR